VKPVVLHVSDFAAPYPGAFITQLRMLDDELRRRGWGRSAFAFPPAAANSEWFRQLRDEGSGIATIDSSPTRAVFKTARELTDMIAGTGAEVLHTHFGSYDVPAVVAVERIRRQGNPCRLLWHYRTALEEAVQARNLDRRIKDFIHYRLAARGIDGCLAVTRALALEAAERGIGQKASAMIAGCDTETFRPEQATRARVRRDLGLTDDDILILHLGWAWIRKGGDLLAAAAQLLQQEGRSGLVFGSVAAPPDVPLVRSLPFTDRICELHQAADIFVSASRSEGFGNGVAEAMATGTVVVATLAAGQREIFEGVAGCVAVPVGDVQQLAEGIEHLLRRRSEWPALGAANRAHITARYDMRDWARRMADFYETSLEIGLMHR
jgi:glycosyltransferase involved in cell wall biosynthesis